MIGIGMEILGVILILVGIYWQLGRIAAALEKENGN